MTWRGFIIGVLGVLGLALLTPVNDYALGNTYLTGNHFPVGVFFFLLVLVFGANVVLKSLRRRWALRRAELMVVFSMMLVSATVPASGLMRYWFPVCTSAPHLAQRGDLYWEDTVLQEAPEGILLSTNPGSVAVRKFFNGYSETESVRVPWGRWAKVILSWGGFLVCYYLGTIFLGAILRRQWIDHERLTFPVVRFPLEFAEGAAERSLLPPICRRKAFVVGSIVALTFGLLRLSPVFFGADTGWLPAFPVREFVSGTGLESTPLRDGRVFPIAIGMAFLVPAEVSFSMWFFYLLTCFEVHAITVFGLPVQGGGWEFIRVQQAGAFIAFTGGVLWLARRHLWSVVKKAFGAGEADDSDEPLPYAVSFWGLAACVVAALLWYAHFGIGPGLGIALLLLIMTTVIVHARLVTQGGVILTGQSWMAPQLLHNTLGGGVFAGPAAVVAQVQAGFLWADSREILSPHVMNSLRACSAVRRGRRLFVPALVLALFIALFASGYSTLRWVYYRHGALNLANTHAIQWGSIRVYRTAHEMIANPTASARPHYVALLLGGGLMAALQALRGLFYWWPLNPLGFLISASWAIRPLWVNFLIGWMIKTGVMKLAGGRALRKGRQFFMGVIAAEIGLVGVTTLFSLLTDVRFGYLFLPS